MILIATIYFITLGILIVISYVIREKSDFNLGWWSIVVLPFVNTLFLGMTIVWAAADIIKRRRRRKRLGC